MTRCSICAESINEENAPILTMGAYGMPKYLCAECAEDIETVRTSRDYSEIKSAFDRLADKNMKSPVIDDFANESLQNILNDAAERAEKIKSGSYDFSLDEKLAAEELDDIPEELRESEEDVRLDERERKRAEKTDVIWNIILALTFVGALAFALVRLLG